MTNESNEGIANYNEILKVYGALSSIDLVENAELIEEDRKILANDLLRYISGQVSPLDKLIKIRLKIDLNLNRLYKILLSEGRVEFFDKPRAASSDSFFERRLGKQGMTLSLKQSKRDNNQYYLILKLPSAHYEFNGKTLIAHLSTPESIERIMFPPIHDGKSQVIVYTSDELFTILNNQEVEIDIHQR